MTDVPVPRSRRAPEVRRRAVLEAARELFSELGVEATSVDRIAARADVAKGTVYLYFPSKAHILADLEMSYSTDLITRIRELCGPGPTRAEAWCGELATAYLESRALHDALFYGQTVANRSASADNALIDDLAEVIRTDPRLPADNDPDATAAFLVGGITTMVDRLLLRSEGGALDTVSATSASRRLAAAALGRT